MRTQKKKRCCLSPWGEEKTLYFEYTFLDGKAFPAPASCNDMCGSEICSKCLADATMDFINNPPDPPGTVYDPSRR